jgi:hypothetical protein
MRDLCMVCWYHWVFLFAFAVLVSGVLRCMQSTSDLKCVVETAPKSAERMYLMCFLAHHVETTAAVYVTKKCDKSVIFGRSAEMVYARTSSLFEGW